MRLKTIKLINLFIGLVNTVCTLLHECKRPIACTGKCCKVNRRKQTPKVTDDDCDLWVQRFCNIYKVQQEEETTFGGVRFQQGGARGVSVTGRNSFEREE